MLVDCPSCKAKVLGRLVVAVDVNPRMKEGETWEDHLSDPGRTSWPARVSLLVCPGCGEAIVVRQFASGMAGHWLDPYRLFPAPERRLESIPPRISEALEEARKSLHAG